MDHQRPKHVDLAQKLRPTQSDSLHQTPEMVAGVHNGPIPAGL